MEEARAVLARLERIEALRRASAPPADLLAELAALAREASEWAEREDDPRARAAAAALAARARQNPYTSLTGSGYPGARRSGRRPCRVPSSE